MYFREELQCSVEPVARTFWTRPDSATGRTLQLPRQCLYMDAQSGIGQCILRDVARRVYQFEILWGLEFRVHAASDRLKAELRTKLIPDREFKL